MAHSQVLGSTRLYSTEISPSYTKGLVVIEPVNKVERRAKSNKQMARIAIGYTMMHPRRSRCVLVA
eukprot:scaffold204358_cov57-Attheya_sp.AAC.8